MSWWCGTGREKLIYSAFGASCSEVEVNMLTGERRVLRTDIMLDAGNSLSPAIDAGQVPWSLPSTCPALSLLPMSLCTLSFCPALALRPCPTSPLCPWSLALCCNQVTLHLPFRLPLV